MVKLQSNIPKNTNPTDLVGRSVYTIDKLNGIAAGTMGYIKNGSDRASNQFRVHFETGEKVDVNISDLRLAPVTRAEIKAEKELYGSYIEELNKKIEFLDETSGEEVDEIEFKVYGIVKEIAKSDPKEQKDIIKRIILGD
jgi:hypothetical protein